MRLLTAFFVFLLTAFPASAQTMAEEGYSVIYAGTLLDRPGHPPRHNASVVVRSGKIEAVQEGFVAPAGAQVIDLRDRFVLPGLIDSHVHLETDRSGKERLLADYTETAKLNAYEALMNAQKTLSAGFTTVRNLGDFGGTTLAFREAIARGWVVGPRIIDAGTPISVTADHLDIRVGIKEAFQDDIEHDNACDGADECRKAVRKQIGRGVDVIKMATSGGVTSLIGAGPGKQMFDDEAKSIVETAHLYGKKVAAHAQSADGILVALRAGVDSIEHGYLADAEDIALMKKNRRLSGTNAFDCEWLFGKACRQSQCLSSRGKKNDRLAP